MSKRIDQKFGINRFWIKIQRSTRLKAFSNFSLGTRISAITSLLFLGALLIIGIVSLNAFRNELKSALVEQQNTFVRRVADDLDQKLLTLQHALVTSAAGITPSNIETSDSAQKYLDTNTGLFSLFDRSVFLFSVEGKLIAEHPFRPNRRGQDFSFRSYIKDTVKTGQPTVSEPFTTTKTDHDTVLMLTAPVYSKDGRLIAILTGSLGLTRPGMLGNIAKAVVGKTGYLYLVTSDGAVIMHPDKSRLSKRLFERGSNPIFDKALDGKAGTEETIEPDGTAVLETYSPVPTSGWILGSRYPVAEAFSPFQKMTKVFITLLLLAGGFVLVSLWKIISSQLRPLRDLTRQIHAHASREGQAEPVEVNAHGEIGDFSIAFNGLVSRLAEHETMLIESTSRYQLITENSTDLIAKLTEEGVITYASPICLTLLGITHEQLIGQTFSAFVHPKDHEYVFNTIQSAIQDGTSKTICYSMRRADHQYVWFETTLRLMPSSGDGAQEILCVSRDISERKSHEADLYDLARHDSLTNLPNRLMLEERVGRSLNEAHKLGLNVAIMVLDLDRFKNINDTLGHGTGDEMLKLAAERLKECVRPSDIVSRWGGDEFVILLSGIKHADAVNEVAERCLDVLRKPFLVTTHSLHVTVSIGISIFPDGGHESEALIKNADTAMYQAKERGGDCHVIYVPEMNAEAQERLSLESDLYFALERKQLVLYYQPMISATTGRLVGAEALIRWQHPTLGLVPPMKFIPIAEATGLIGQIGEWVLMEACSQMIACRRRGLEPIGISVNLSSRQFRRDSLVQSICKALDETGLEPHLLELEITETLLMDDVKHSAGVIKEIKKLGVKISVDDFGTGYSSLSYLNSFPLDKLKIDQSFVRELTTKEGNGEIVLATVALAKSLRLKIVAEGVETMDQMDFLMSAECDELQGYFFSRPMPIEDFFQFAIASPTFLKARKQPSLFPIASDDA
jgi:diguanylate cyclase (GGDEF)-like protein/PAS domain S-box-containing protein